MGSVSRQWWTRQTCPSHPRAYSPVNISQHCIFLFTSFLPSTQIGNTVFFSLISRQAIHKNIYDVADIREGFFFLIAEIENTINFKFRHLLFWKFFYYSTTGNWLDFSRSSSLCQTDASLLSSRYNHILIFIIVFENNFNFPFSYLLPGILSRTKN